MATLEPMAEVSLALDAMEEFKAHCKNRHRWPDHLKQTVDRFASGEIEPHRWVWVGSQLIAEPSEDMACALAMMRMFSK